MSQENFIIINEVLCLLLCTPIIGDHRKHVTEVGYSETYARPLDLFFLTTWASTNSAVKSKPIVYISTSSSSSASFNLHIYVNQSRLHIAFTKQVCSWTCRVRFRRDNIPQTAGGGFGGKFLLRCAVNRWRQEASLLSYRVVMPSWLYLATVVSWWWEERIEIEAWDQ